MMLTELPIVRLKHALTRPDGGSFKAGALLFVGRVYLVNGNQTRLQLLHGDGECALPCVDPDDVICGVPIVDELTASPATTSVTEL